MSLTTCGAITHPASCDTIHTEHIVRPSARLGNEHIHRAVDTRAAVPVYNQNRVRNEDHILYLCE